jgi:deoxyribonuclease-2
VLAIDTKTSFWIQHSIPRFAPPFNTSAFSYPDNALNNGQHIVCITLSTSISVDQVLNQLLIMRPSVYAYNADERFLLAHPAFQNLINRRFSNSKFKQISMKTVGGVSFQHFAKSPKLHQELYVDLVAPAVNANLTVQSWRNGRGGRLQSTCNTTFDVFNIQEVSLKQTDLPTDKKPTKPKRANKRSSSTVAPGTDDPKISSIVWKTTEDHSKWAASDNKKRPVSCLGDINRMRSQFARGGGALCMQDINVWYTVSGSAQEIEPCPINQ